MTSFEDLGLREELLRTLEEEELESATALQAAVIPVLRRGGNLVARASTGSGKTLAYGLGVLDGLQPRQADSAEEGEEAGDVGGGARALLLLPTEEAAEHVATTLFPYVQALGLGITTAGGSWATPVGRAEVVVATAATAMEAVRASALKLDGIEALVIDGARAVLELGEWERVDGLMDHLPRDAQRVIFTSALAPEIDDLIDRRVKRALRYPAEPAVAGVTAPEPEGGIGYVVATEREKIELLARLLTRGADSAASAPVLFCRTDERAAQVAERLTMRGFLVGELDDEDTDIVLVAAGISRAALVEGGGAAPERTLSYDVPADAETLRARHAGDENAIVFVEPRELAHLHDIAMQARLAPRAYSSPADATGSHSARTEQFRQEIERALREEDLGAQLLVLEPLLETYPAVEIAAAASALLRRRSPAPPAPQQQAARAAPAASAAAAGAPTMRAPRTGAATSPRPQAGPPPATFTRLFLSVGSRDGIRPGDLVGAIAGEAEIPGAQVGKIDIRDSFSIVEVQAPVAERVITALNGTTMKGRSLRVDYDRGADRSRRPTGGRSGPGGPGGRPREGGADRRPPPRRREQE